MLKKLIAVVAGIVVAYCVWQGQAQQPAGEAEAPAARASSEAHSRNDALERAISAHSRGAQVSGDGVVTKVLRDDTSGARHQRFLMRVQGGTSLLVAYNLDIAPRIPGLKPGAAVGFSGEYIWNDRGGVLHWTHRDPAHRHPDGYIRYDGHLYR